MRFRYLAVLVGLLTLACGSFSSDLDNLCAIATDVQTEGVAPEQRSSTISQRFMESGPTSKMKKVMIAMANASPDIRYEMLQRVAAEEGRANWECPALETIWAADASTE